MIAKIDVEVATSVTRVVHRSAYKGICRPRFFILALMLFLIRDIYQHTSCFYIYSEDITLPSCISEARFAFRLRSLSCTRRRTFTRSRIPYDVTGTSSFQLVLKSGDIHRNPGPHRKRCSTPKYPCGECQQTVTNKQDAILCAECKTWFHTKCIHMGKHSFQYYLVNYNLDWTCLLCSLPKCGNSFFDQSGEESTLELSYANLHREQENANVDSPPVPLRRTKETREILLIHMNVNSLQNKVEEVGSLIKESKAQVVFLTETKIDCTYPDSQFAQNGYSINRNDRKKGGGGVMAYISDKLPSKRLGLPRKFTTIEPLAIQSKLGRHDALIVGIYRPPKPIGNNYHVTLENDLHDLTSWASVQKTLLVITGDLNLDRLRPFSREGKILCDLEDTQGLTCVITRPTRITINSQTLIDVILTNKPELFKDCGVFDVGISDHALVCGLMKERNGFYESKVLTVRSYRDLNEKELQMDLDMAPWHVSSIFDSIDDQYSYWHS